MKRRIKSKSFSIVAPVGFWDKPVASLVFVIFSLILLFLSTINPSIFSGIRSSASNAISPAISLVSYPLQEATQFVRNVSGLSSLQARNAALEQENARLREWYQTALFLEQQNQSLQKLLNVKLDPQYEYITARLIADVGSAFVKSILVRAGQQDGIQKGQAVISGDGLLGRIIDVSNQTSRILLITDMNSRVPVMIESSKQHAILAGQNSAEPVLEHLPDGVNISKGANVVTSGRGGMFPVGIPVGYVSKIDGKVRVSITADLNNIQYVRIVSEKETIIKAQN